MTTATAPQAEKAPVNIKAIDRELWRRVGAQAKLEGTTISELVERVLQEYLKKPRVK